MWTGLHTIVALRAPFEKERFFDSAGRAQPILADYRSRLVWNGFFVLGEFLCSPGN